MRSKFFVGFILSLKAYVFVVVNTTNLAVLNISHGLNRQKRMMSSKELCKIFMCTFKNNLTAILIPFQKIKAFREIFFLIWYA